MTRIPTAEALGIRLQERRRHRQSPEMDSATTLLAEKTGRYWTRARYFHRKSNQRLGPFDGKNIPITYYHPHSCYTVARPPLKNIILEISYLEGRGTIALPPVPGLLPHFMWYISASKKDSCSSLSGPSLSFSYASPSSATASSTLTLRAFLVFFAFGADASSSLAEGWLAPSSSSSSSTVSNC
jgi:hypothetical protein